MVAHKSAMNGGLQVSSLRRHDPMTVSAFVSNVLFLSTCLLNAAQAQTAPEASVAEASGASAVQEVTVTGTRIVRDGYQAPAPLTVVGAEQIQTQGTANVADYMNTLPAFSGSLQPNATNASTSGGTSGIQALNLRSLGPQRTLVLIDGQRVVGIDTTQLVDINLIPQSLISRVEVVTGGASAQYGSDALAGVVNFILDKNFTGVKADVSGGATTYGDDGQWNASLTAGTGFANDRGHFLINGEVNHDDGIPIANRAWNLTGRQFMINPNYKAGNGQPQWLLLDHVSPMNTIANGAIIASGPLQGIVFGPGGQQYNYHYGSLVSSPDNYNSPNFAGTQVRGTVSGGGLTSRETTQNVFTRTSFDVTDDIQVFAQASWAHNFNYNWCCTVEDPGNIKILSGNPYIPANIQSQMTAQGLSSISLGSQNPDFPANGGLNNRRTERYVLGGNGKFDLFGTRWKWDAYYQKGISYQHAEATNNIVYSYYGKAIDAVTAPNGGVVCRVTLTNPNDPCVPYNPFGVGVNSKSAINYVLGNGASDYRDERFEQDVGSASVSGEPFSDWAGPISVATGVEHRKEHVSGSDDPLSQAKAWWVGNYQVFTAGYSVTEGFIETAVPLAKDMPFAKDLELHGAARATDYSTSGYVTTWNIGATWRPIDGIMFRGQRSRDIRAPNLLELFNAGGGGAPGVLNPFLNNESETIHSNTVGNPNLKPEQSNAYGIGMVLQPTFLPSFSASVDFWNLNISEAIGTLTAQQIINNCYLGNGQQCAAISFGDGQHINEVNVQPFNLVNQIVRGIDYEASYGLRLHDLVASWPGGVDFRVLATNFKKDYSSNGINAPVDYVGQNNGSSSTGNAPRWRYSSVIAYSNDPLSVSLTARGLSAGTYNNTYVQCTSNCPVSTVLNTTVSDNHLPGALYFDLSVDFKVLHRAADGGADFDVYLNVRNLTNKDPAILANTPGGYSYSLESANGYLYDTLGRIFRTGFRVKF